MGCPSCGQNIVKNLYTAAKAQPNKLKWFADGTTGLIQSVGGIRDYTPEDVQKNRDTCRDCEFSTKNSSGKLNALSQCMAPDHNGAPCACFILAKSENGDCPKGKYTTLRISAKSQ